ncbi:MAG: RluA family pseudouridine synthase [Lachnospiraceae bacterium]|jgi:23S rRNA pseudouridine1911/1915/1917 synthase
MNAFELENNILYEDQEILVCYKPAGFPVQSARIGTMDMESALRGYLAAKRTGREMPYLAVIHRLDQPVEGVLVFAKTQSAAKELNRQLTSHAMEKRYLAVVQGYPKEKEAILTDYLEKDGKTNTSRVVSKRTAQSKQAVLSYQLVQTIGEQSLLSICLKTGRHHQIRVQLSHAGLPLVGDTKYNPGEKGKQKSLALCASSLTFMHPKTRKQFTYTVQPHGEIFQPFLDL